MPFLLSANLIFNFSNTPFGCQTIWKRILADKQKSRLARNEFNPYSASRAFSSNFGNMPLAEIGEKMIDFI